MPKHAPSSRFRWLSGTALLGVLTASGGCAFFPPVPPAVPLTQTQITQVENCQKGVTAAGRAFVNTKLLKLEACVQEVLRWRLRFENGLIDQAEYDAKLEATRNKCRTHYEAITKASTTFVDDVIAKCQDAEDAVLGEYDALRFVLGGESLFGPPTTLEELAGGLCGAKEAGVDALLSVQMPRALEVLSYLGPEFVILEDGVPTDPDTITTGFPNVPLDPRCLSPATAPVLQRLLQPAK